ncbi:MAG: hypothetical protein LBN43_04475 [Oscillospiraceae bacterium]|jgi:hypothetical protein|nr:hypothetical protein [Oscillospiraceae bacterium]
MEQLSLSLLPKDGVKMLDSLRAGNLIAVKSKNDFMYVILRKGEYQMFLHTIGAPNGGTKRFEDNEKYAAIVKNFAQLSDLAVEVAFDEKTMNIYHVMASAEEAILTEFPGDDRDLDETVDFTPPNELEDDGDEGSEDE